jgi:hypothetical protein
VLIPYTHTDIYGMVTHGVFESEGAKFFEPDRELEDTDYDFPDSVVRSADGAWFLASKPQGTDAQLAYTAMETEDAADWLSANGYTKEAAELRTVRRGRPRVGPVVKGRIPQSVYDAFRNDCITYDMTESEMLRAIVAYFYEPSRTAQDAMKKRLAERMPTVDIHAWRTADRPRQD